MIFSLIMIDLPCFYIVKTFRIDICLHNSSSQKEGRTVKTNPNDNHRNEPQTSQQFTGNRDKRFDGKPSVKHQETSKFHVRPSGALNSVFLSMSNYLQFCHKFYSHILPI